MQFNVAHENVREWEEFEDIESEQEDEDHDVVHEITIIEFGEQTRRKEQLENGKSGEKNHNEGESVGRDRISKHQPKDFPPLQHSPLT
jgi:hypothetical protein